MCPDVSGFHLRAVAVVDKIQSKTFNFHPIALKNGTKVHGGPLILHCAQIDVSANGAVLGTENNDFRINLKRAFSRISAYTQQLIVRMNWNSATPIQAIEVAADARRNGTGSN